MSLLWRGEKCFRDIAEQIADSHECDEQIALAVRKRASKQITQENTAGDSAEEVHKKNGSAQLRSPSSEHLWIPSQDLSLVSEDISDTLYALCANLTQSEYPELGQLDLAVFFDQKELAHDLLESLESELETEREMALTASSEDHNTTPQSVTTGGQGVPLDRVIHMGTSCRLELASKLRLLSTNHTLSKDFGYSSLLWSCLSLGCAAALRHVPFKGTGPKSS